MRLFCQTVKLRFLAQVEYPGAYAAGIIAQWIAYGADMVMIFIMVWQFGALAGWSPDEVVFSYAVWLLTYAIGASFTYNMCQQFPQMAVSGTLDEAYIRPVSPFFYLIASNYNVGYISHFIITIAAMALSLTRLDLAWSPWQWAWLAVTVAAGSVIQGCMHLIFHMPGIRTYTRAPTAVFFWEGREFTQYPVSIYPKPLQLVFMSVLPFAFANFYPVQVLLGKRDGLFAGAAVWLSPAVAALMVALTALCWRWVTKGYESAGT